MSFLDSHEIQLLLATLVGWLFKHFAIWERLSRAWGPEEAPTFQDMVQEALDGIREEVVQGAVQALQGALKKRLGEGKGDKFGF